jgi:cupin fold WbuC family metalloprotein
MINSFLRLNLLDPNLNQVSVHQTPESLTFFVQVSPILVDEILLNEMQILSDRNPRFVIRLCLHSSPESIRHDMILLKPRGRYFPPHLHPKNSETLLVLRGKLGLVRFNGLGEIMDGEILQVGALIRLTNEDYYFEFAASDSVVFLETKSGPHIRSEDLQIPDWAPAASDDLKAQHFLKTLHGQLTETYSSAQSDSDK